MSQHELREWVLKFWSYLKYFALNETARSIIDTIARKQLSKAATDI